MIVVLKKQMERSDTHDRSRIRIYFSDFRGLDNGIGSLGNLGVGDNNGHGNNYVFGIDGFRFDGTHRIDLLLFRI